MCYNGKCLNRFTLRTGCLILGYTSAITAGIAMVASLAAFLSKDLWTYYHYEVKEFAPRLAIIFSVMFSFSTIFIYGIHKNQPGKVRAYFIHGIGNVVIIGLIIIAEATFLTKELWFILLAMCVIYSWLLHMVKLTYEDMTTRPAYNAVNVEPIFL